MHGLILPLHIEGSVDEEFIDRQGNPEHDEHVNHEEESHEAPLVIGAYMDGECNHQQPHQE